MDSTYIIIAEDKLGEFAQLLDSYEQVTVMLVPITGSVDDFAWRIGDLPESYVESFNDEEYDYLRPN